MCEELLRLACGALYVLTLPLMPCVQVLAVRRLRPRQRGRGGVPLQRAQLREILPPALRGAQPKLPCSRGCRRGSLFITCSSLQHAMRTVE